MTTARWRRRDLGRWRPSSRRIGELAGPPEPPSRIHGDLWSGNVLWSGGRGWPIDPAAHGGHRETDLAMLALFGAPQLGGITRGYAETAPLAEGLARRVPLHQLHPLLVHVCLFGGGYVPQSLTPRGPLSWPHARAPSAQTFVCAGSRSGNAAMPGACPMGERH